MPEANMRGLLMLRWFYLEGHWVASMSPYMTHSKDQGQMEGTIMVQCMISMQQAHEAITDLCNSDVHLTWRMRGHHSLQGQTYFIVLFSLRVNS